MSASITMEAEPVQNTSSPPYWAAAAADQGVDTSVVNTDYEAPMYPLQRAPTSMSVYSDISGRAEDAIPSTNTVSGDFMFPSLPVESPPDTWDPFGGISASLQDMPPLTANVDVWPAQVNEETLLPWIDVYFKRLHPTVPVLNRTNMYREMLMRKHHIDTQYGAMLLGLCAFAMTQPVQIHERANTPSRSAQAQMLMQECVKMRVVADFGEDPTIEMVLTSFFLFACLFGNNRHRAARLRLREAVDLAYSMGLHLPLSYEGLEPEAREQYLRTYLVLSVTERAYALQQRLSIDFRGRPGIAARFMQSFGPSDATNYITTLLYQDPSDAVGMIGLMYLMETFDAIDENVINCWNGNCRFSDGACEMFDRRRALQMFRAQHKAREACLSGSISFAPSASPVPLAQLAASQIADISVTQFWLLNRLWNLCLSHGLLREESEYSELRYEFACQIGRVLLHTCNELSLEALETHGIGIVEKIYDVTIGVTTAVSSSTLLMLDSTVSGDTDLPAPVNGIEPAATVAEILQGLRILIQTLRGGDHQYTLLVESAINGVLS